jgi:uncharacterized spore protein YtfJ
MKEFDEIIERIGNVSQEVNVNAVFGEPRTIEGRTLIPVAELTFGFGMGMGSGPTEAPCCEGDDEEACCQMDEEACCETDEEGLAESGADDVAMGAGGGAGAHARPIAYIEVGPDGTRVKPIEDEQKVALAGILLGFWTIGWAGLVLKALFGRK